MDSKDSKTNEAPGDGAYQVLARRFRPQCFDEIVGQEAVVASLTKCLEQQRLPHAFLFCGSRGIGKTTSARILARAVNCEKGAGPNPCGECPSCREILSGHASDVIELDAASHNGVDEVRALREQAGYAPLHLRRKVFILDEVHMFSKSAFNALLKILEEPPEHVLFILATTELHKVPDTVQSRCQVLSFRRIHEGHIQGRLQQISDAEGVSIAPEILAEIAASSLGGLRDAETALERVLPLAEGMDLEGYQRLEGRVGLTKCAEFLDMALAGNLQEALAFASKAVESGVDERECMGEILSLLRQLFYLRVDGKDSLLVDAGGEWRDRLVGLAARAELEQVDAMMQILLLARDRIRSSEDRRVLLELTLVRLARLSELRSLAELSSGEPVPVSSQAASNAAPSRPAGSGSQRPARPLGNAGKGSTSKSKSDASAEDRNGGHSSSKTRGPVPAAAGPSFWPSLVQKASAERRMLGLLLGRAQVELKDPKKLVLSFDGLKALESQVLEQEDNLLYLRQLVKQSAGQDVEVEVHTRAGDPPKQGGQSTEAGGKVAQDPGSKRSKPARTRKPGPTKGASGKQRNEKGKAGKPRSRSSAAGEEGEDLPPIGETARDLFSARFLDHLPPKEE